jgi:hypothetical protein
MTGINRIIPNIKNPQIPLSICPLLSSHPQWVLSIVNSVLALSSLTNKRTMHKFYVKGMRQACGLKEMI